MCGYALCMAPRAAVIASVPIPLKTPVASIWNRLGLCFLLRMVKFWETRCATVRLASPCMQARAVRFQVTIFTTAILGCSLTAPTWQVWCTTIYFAAVRKVSSSLVWLLMSRLKITTLKVVDGGSLFLARTLKVSCKTMSLKAMHSAATAAFLPPPIYPHGV